MAFSYGTHDEVIRSRTSFLAKNGLRLEHCVVPALSHGDTILPVGKAECGRGALTPDDPVDAEAIVTAEHGVVLFMLTADCFPVAYHDPIRGIIALAHLGWRPAGKLLAGNVVRLLVDRYGSKPADINVHIGPGIHAASYRKTDIEQKDDPRWQPYLSPVPDSDETAIDLLGFVVAQLADSGVLSANITIDQTDTAASDATFSHYRAKRTGEPEGRFATVLAFA